MKKLRDYPTIYAPLFFRGALQARHAKLDIWDIEEAFAEFTKKCKRADVRRSKLFLDLIKMYDQTVGYLIDEEAAEKARNNAKIGRA